MMKRKIALDVGDVRIGVAVSDLLGITANPRETYVRKKDNIDADIAYFCDYAKKEDADAFVLGLPKNMDSTIGERAQKCIEFAQKLEEELSVKTVTWDERLTTVSAHGFLNNTNTRGQKRKNIVDAVSAVIILQDYLAYRKNTEKK